MAEYVGLSKPILINSQNVNVDYLYGPYTSLSLALSSIAPALRSVGKTVGVIENNIVVEYTFKGGITDADLIKKVPDTLTKADVTTIVDSAISEISSKPSVIDSDEQLVGSYNINKYYGNQNIYEKSIALDSLPVTEGLTKDYVIFSEPIGFGIYFNVCSFICSSGIGLLKNFYNASYQITKFYIDENYQSCVTIKCISTISESVNGILTLQYCKFIGDKIGFDVTVPSTIDKSAVNISIPVLKFNKKFIFSYINDDSYCNYQFIFSPINKRLVVTSFKPSPDDTREMTWHYGMEDDTQYTSKIVSSYTPTEFLQSSDGAGLYRRFSTTVAVWPDKLKDQSIGQIVGGFWPWLSEREIKFFKNYGFMMGYHDIIGYGAGTTTQALFDKCMTDTANTFKANAGIVPKLMIEPNGDHNYLTFSQNNPYVQVMTAQNGPITKLVYPYTDSFTLDKGSLAIQRIFAYGTGTTYYDFIMGELAKFNSATDKNTIYWLIGSAHRSNLWETEMFTAINNLYGSKGNDSIWVTTLDEMYEYTFMRKGTVFKKTLTTNGIHYDMYVPSMPNFWFRDLSVILTGISSLDGVSVTSDNNVYGTSYAINNSSLLVNLNFDTGLTARVESFVSDYEKNPTKNYKYDDACYFTQMLKPGLKEPYLNRINSINILKLLTFTINNKNTSTSSNNVSLAFTYSGTAPTYYMVSENSDFTGASWVAYSTPVSFTLSSGYGTKTIYAKLKNDSTETSSLSSQISYVNPDALSLDSVVINNGQTGTSSGTVSVKINTTGTPSKYKIGKVSDLSDCTDWITWAGSTVTYASGMSSGTLIVYVQVGNTTVTSSIVSSSIQITDTITASIVLADGAETYQSLTVPVSFNVTSGTPTYYRLSETKAGITSSLWLSYSVSKSYTFSNYGSKTLYGQLRSSTTESNISSDTITLQSSTIPKLLFGNVADTGTTIAGVGYVNAVYDNNNNNHTIYAADGTTAYTRVGSYKPYASGVYSTLDTKYSCTHLGGSGNNAHWAIPTLSAVEGEYPNSMIVNGTLKSVATPMLFQCTGNTRQAILILKDVTAGDYKIRLLVSDGSMPSNGLPVTVFAQDQHLVIPLIDQSVITNNNSNYYTFDSVTVDSDGYLCISMGYPNYVSGAYGYTRGPSPCIIEITKL